MLSILAAFAALGVTTLLVAVSARRLNAARGMLDRALQTRATVPLRQLVELQDVSADLTSSFTRRDRS